ncbi:MAG: hypothetical protein Kow00121_42010 [Elainellaceae cyanobacterium]
MDSRTIYLLAALLGGAILPVQVAINTLLRRYLTCLQDVNRVAIEVAEYIRYLRMSGVRTGAINISNSRLVALTTFSTILPSRNRMT